MNTSKFRLRLTLFDALVLLAALGVGAFLLWNTFKPQQTSDVTPQSAATVRYSVRFEHWPVGVSEMVQINDLLIDNVKNYEMGRITSIEVLPNQHLLLDHVNRKLVLSEMEGFEDVLVTVEAPCTVTGKEITVGGGYILRVGITTYIRGEGYMASGPIVAMEVEEAK